MSTDAARTKLRELIATKQQWLRQWQAPELLSPGRSDMIHILSDNIAELQQVLAELDKAEPQEPDSPERRCGGPGCDMRCCQPVEEPVAWADKISFEGAMASGKGHDVWPKAGDYETRTGRALIGLYTAPPQRPAEPVQEPVAGVVLNEEGRAALVEHGREEWHCVVRNARRLYAAPPKRPAEPAAYSVGRTLHWHDGKGGSDAQLFAAPPQRKPLTEEKIERAYREIWRDLPSDFDHTSSGWIEQGIRYAERAHGINYDNQDNKR